MSKIKKIFWVCTKTNFFLFHKCWQMLHEWDRVDEQILEWTLTRVRLRLRDFQWNRDFNMCVFAFQFKMTTSVKWLKIVPTKPICTVLMLRLTKKSVSLNYIKLMLYHFCLNRRLCTRVRTKIPKCAGCYWRMK